MYTADQDTELQLCKIIGAQYLRSALGVVFPKNYTQTKMRVAYL